MRSEPTSCICSIIFFKINGKDTINVYITRKHYSCLCWLCPEELMNNESSVENIDMQCSVLFLFPWIFTHLIFHVPWFWWQSCTERTELSIRNTLSVEVISKFLGECRVPFLILSELDIFRANNMHEIFTAEQTINNFFFKCTFIYINRCSIF